MIMEMILIKKYSRLLQVELHEKDEMEKKREK